VRLIECDRKGPGLLGFVVLRQRIIQGYNILAGKRKEKSLLEVVGEGNLILKRI
jgi:hypothetical protein